MKSSGRQIKSLPLICTRNHLYSFTPFHFRQHPSKTFYQYCQVNIYYSCNFPKLLSVCKQNGLICPNHIKNKEDNFAKFHSAFCFFINLTKLQINQNKQIPPWEKKVIHGSNNILFQNTKFLMYSVIDWHCAKGPSLHTLSLVCTLPLTYIHTGQGSEVLHLVLRLHAIKHC